MLAYILNTGSGLISLNIEDSQRGDFEQKNAGSFREFTSTEYDSVGVANIKYVSQKTTEITGATPQNATIVFTTPAPVPEDYTVLRARAYPAIGDQLDMLYHAMDSGEIQKATEWFNAVKAVKDAYPKTV